MRVDRFPTVSCAFWLLVLVGCSQPGSVDSYDIPEPPPLEWARVIGFVDSGGLSNGPLRVPETVTAGSSFTVTVSTYGSSCIRPAGIEVQVVGSSADLTPYDSVPASGPPCLPDWMAFPRDVEIRFATPGGALVRLHGRGFPGDLRIERAMTVVP
jgi:hypothetical protein